MTFLSVEFAILISCVLVLLALIKDKRAVQCILLLGSYIFYACFDLRFLAVLISLSLFTYAGGRLICINRQARNIGRAHIIMTVFVSFEILLLAFFKYMHMIPMPVGLSFYLLQAISYLVDLYRGDLAETPSLIDSLIYIGFFPQIVSGPIIKAKEFFPQLSDRKRLNTTRLSYGIQLFTIGTFMKLVMADRLSVCVDKVYSAPLAYSGLSLFVTSIGYSLQLLFDFAGYSNMAIGIAYLLGFDYGRNFNLPYLSGNLSEFWRRWHISLSSWLKDYVYIPLGGSRKGKLRTYINTFITMVISGLWHGSTVNFLLWGALHGLLQIIGRILRNIKKERKVNPPLFLRTLSCIVCFLFVDLLWIPFRAENLAETYTIVSRILTFKPGIRYYYVYIFIFGAVLLALQTIAVHINNGDDPVRPLPLDKLYGKVIFCVLVIATAMFAYFGNGAFIYSQF